MVKIQPFGDRLLIKVIHQEEVMAGGVLVAPVAKEKSNRGLVVALGDGDSLSCVKEGDIILFPVGVGLNYSTDSADYKIIGVRDVLGKIIEE